MLRKVSALWHNIEARVADPAVENKILALLGCAFLLIAPALLVFAHGTLRSAGLLGAAGVQAMFALYLLGPSLDDLSLPRPRPAGQMVIATVVNWLLAAAMGALTMFIWASDAPTVDRQYPPLFYIVIGLTVLVLVLQALLLPVVAWWGWFGARHANAEPGVHAVEALVDLQARMDRVEGQLTHLQSDREEDDAVRDAQSRIRILSELRRGMRPKSGSDHRTDPHGHGVDPDGE